MRAAVIGSYGVRFRVSARTNASLDAMLCRLPGRWNRVRDGDVARIYEVVETGAANGHCLLRVDGEETFRSRSIDEVLVRFEAAARFHVAERSAAKAFVHAGAVAWRGRAIVLPGKSADGKTTLTAALVREGARYLSDEFALVDDSGRIHPFAKPLSLAGRPGEPPRLLTVQELGGVQERRPVPPGLVVFTAYGTSSWRPRPLTPGEGMLQLLQHTVSTRLHPRSTLRRLERLATSAVLLKGRRGEAEATAVSILGRLEKIIEEGRFGAQRRPFGRV